MGLGTRTLILKHNFFATFYAMQDVYLARLP